MISSSNIDYSMNNTDFNTDFELEVARSTELDQSEFETYLPLYLQ